MPSWQRPDNIPKDGTIFLFRYRSFTTCVLMDPLVGRYRDGELEWNNKGEWKPFGYDPDMWCEIPELP
jgi:hypothetical protein